MTASGDCHVAHHEQVHICPQKTFQCFLRPADDWLIFVKGCIEDHWYVCNCTKAFNQTMINRIGVPRNRLQPPGTIDVSNGRNEFPSFFTNLKHLHHEWNGIILLK